MKDVATIKKLLPLHIRRALPQEVKIVALGPKEMQKLNIIYRGEAKPTNVLSFGYDNDYGEILVCPSIIRKEARRQKRGLRYQMTWMILHGMLHLAGMHHEKSESAARRVEKLEREILSKFGVRK